jgi:hypothetical protein
MRKDYRQWLDGQKYDIGTLNAQMYRVEEHHGDLDEHYARDRMTSLLLTLGYSMDDMRHNRPNPSKIPFDGDIRNNLASYRNAVERYRKFRDAVGNAVDTPATGEMGTVAAATVEEEIGQRLGLERDLQAALRIRMDRLESSLTIIDDGAERSVESGFIDIMARDASGTPVVIELKAGLAGQRAVAQILSYMGDVADEEESGKVREILVASDFDPKAKAAARMVPNLVLRRYSVQFLFSDGDD